MKMQRKQKVIILVALVITIILLLILAGIVTGTLMGENGLITRVKETDENINSTKFSYTICEKIDNKVTILIRVQDEENGLSRIELPDKNPIIVEANKKKEIGIDYEVEIEKEYNIKITLEGGETKEERILIRDYWSIPLVQPSIVVVQRGGIPVLTRTGATVSNNSIFELESNENEIIKTYYSIDEGQNWELYIEPVITSSTKIMAKSIINFDDKNCESCLESEVAIESLTYSPYVILNESGYDGDFETESYVGNVRGVIFGVDDSIWGTNLVTSIIVRGNNPDSVGTREYVFDFIDNDGQVIRTSDAYSCSFGKVVSTSEYIPKETVLIQIRSVSDSIYYLSVKEVSFEENIGIISPDDYVCSSIWDPTHSASKAFDDSEEGYDYWHAANGSKVPQYCGARFNEKIYIKKFYLSCYYQSKQIVLQASNNGKDWIDIQSYTCSKKKDTYEVTNEYTEKYNYYCIKTITTSGPFVAYWEIKFYGY